MNRAQKAVAGADVLIDFGAISEDDRDLVGLWAAGMWLDLATRTKAESLATLCIESYDDAHEAH